jgi:membrane protease YdiL (CAAX protease family)
MGRVGAGNSSILGILPITDQSGAGRIDRCLRSNLAAVVLKLSGEGLRGLRRLLGRLFVWRVDVRWYLFALLWPAAISLATTAVYVLSGGGAPDFSNPPFLKVYPLPPELAAISPWPLLPLVFLQYVLFGSPMGEEIGWRGYALPRMQTEWSALRASIVLGFLWGVAPAAVRHCGTSDL